MVGRVFLNFFYHTLPLNVTSLFQEIFLKLNQKVGVSPSENSFPSLFFLQTDKKGLKNSNLLKFKNLKGLLKGFNALKVKF